MSWKPPRLTIGGIGVLVLILAVDLAIVGRATLARSVADPAVVALVLLPMIDALMIGAYRLRRHGRRTPRAWARWIGGAIGTLAVSVGWIAAYAAGFDALDAIQSPFDGIPFLRDPYSGPFATVLDPIIRVVFGLIYPIVAVNLPPVVIALVAGRIATRWQPAPPPAPPVE